MNIARLENKLFVLSETTGVSVYDFDFELHLACSHPYRIEDEAPCRWRARRPRA